MMVKSLKCKSSESKSGLKNTSIVYWLSSKAHVLGVKDLLLML